MHDPSCPHGQSFGACLAPPPEASTVLVRPAVLGPAMLARIDEWRTASPPPLRVDVVAPDPVAAGDPWPLHLRLPAVGPLGPVLRPDSRPDCACPPCSGACSQGRDCPSGPCRPLSAWVSVPAAAPWLILAAAAVAAVLNQFFL